MTTKQQANRMAFGHRYGKSKSKADNQIERTAKRFAANKARKKG